MASSNGQKFAEFQALTDSQKLDYLYLEMQNQKSDLRWYVGILTAVLVGGWELLKTTIKGKLGVNG